MDLNRHQASTSVTAYFTGGALAAIGSIALVSPPAFAQLILDGTLGTTVNPGAAVEGLPAILIEGGTPANSNLFHSFQEFNVNTGQRVYFANPIEIQNILTRVTGGTVSTIDGLLGVDGAANLFLLNPNGVIFGPNAQLDINGSFLTSTANSLFFTDGTEFSTTSTVSDLLAINVPLGVQFNNPPQGNITNGGSLGVGQGQTLTLFGNTVLSSGRLAAPAGEIQVLGNQIELAANATVDVSDLESVGIGTISFKADEMNFAAGSVLSGTGALELQPFQTAQSITLGGQLDTGIFSLDLTATDLAAIGEGFSRITIGRADSTGAIALAGDTTFSDPTALLTGGTINTTGGTLTGIDNADLTLQAGTGITTGPITSGGNLLLTTDNPVLLAPITGSGTLQIQPFSTTLGIALGGLGAPEFTYLSQDEINQITDGFGSITIGRADSTGAIAFAGDATFSDPTILLTGGTIDTTGGTLTGIDNVSLTLQAASGINAGAVDTAASGGDIRLISNSPISTNALLNAGGNLEFLTLENVPGTVSGLDGSTFVATRDIRLGDYAGVAIKIETPGSLAAGNITVNAPNTTFDDPNLTTLQAGTAITFGSINTGGNLLLTTDNPILLAPITGNGTLQIQPFSTTLDIVLGGTGDVTSAFLSQGEINQIVDGFGSITIGRADSTGAIALAGDTTFSDPTTLLTNGTIDTTLGTLTSNDALILKANTIQVANLAGASIALEGAVTTADNSVFTADEIDFVGTVSGTGNLTLQPASTTQAIVLGGNADGGATTLDLQNSDLLALQDGFSGITIGRADSTGAIALSGDTTFTDPTTLLTGGTIDTTGGTLTGIDNADLTLQAETGITTGSITSGGNLLLTTDNPLLQGSITGNGTLQIQPFSTTLDIALGGTGDVTSAFLSQGEIDQIADGFSGITIGRADSGSAIALAGDATFRDPTTLLTGGIIDTTGGTLTGEDNASLTLRADNGITTGLINTLNTVDGAGNIFLISDGAIETLAILESGGDLAFLTLGETAGSVLNSNGSSFAARGDVFLGNYQGSLLTLNTDGNIIANSIDTSGFDRDGGAVNLDAGGDITVFGSTDTSSGVANAGSVTFSAEGAITISVIDTFGNGGNGGSVLLDAGGDITVSGLIGTSSLVGNGGDIDLNAGGNITVSGATNTSAISAFDPFDPGLDPFDPGLPAPSPQNSGSLSIQASGNVVLGSDSGPFFHAGQPVGTGVAGDVAIQGASVTLSGTIDPAAFVDLGGTSGNTTITSTSGDINLSNGVIFGDTAGDLNEVTQSQGGDITLNSALNIRLSNYSLESSYGGSGESAGNTSLTANQNIFIDNKFNSITTDSFSGGTPGDISLTSTEGNITVQGEISSESLSNIPGSASAVTLAAENGSVLLDGAFLNTSTFGAGDGGTVAIAADVFTARNSQIEANTSGAGDGGTVAIAADVFTAQNSQVKANTSGAGDGGNITIDTGIFTATDSEIRARSTINATGAGGDISITSSEIKLVGSSIDAGTSGNATSAQGGNVELTTSGGIQLSEGSVISANTERSGGGGTIEIDAGFLSLMDGSQLSADARGSGTGGDIAITTNGTIQAEDFDAAEEMGTVGFGIFLDNSQISARVSGDGNGEDVSIAINTDSLALRNGGRILTQTSGTGNAGDVVLEVDRAIDIQGTNDQGFNSGIAVSSTAPSSGAGGNILINQGSPRGTLTIANNGYLSALTRSASDAGNIDINVTDLILRSGGQIITNSSSTGEAGSINVTATNNILISGRSVQEAASFSTSPFSGATAPTALTFGIEPDPDFDPVLEGASFASKIDENGTGSFAYFSFQVTEAGSSGVFDIDNGETFVDQSSFEPEATSIDTELFLFDQATGELLASNDDSNFFSEDFQPDSGSDSFLDSYLEYTFSQSGDYVIGVGQFDSYADDSTLIEGASPQPGQTYDLRVSVQSAANGQIEIPGENPNPNVVDANQRIPSGLFAQASAAGAGGDITINGTIAVNEETGDLTASQEPVRLFQLENNASVSADATGTGRAGNISINTERFQIKDASISVSSTAGDAGDLLILANSTDGKGFSLYGSELTAEAGGDNAGGGSIFIEANDPVLTLTDRSLISAKATGANATGGNVTINAPNSFILATPFNDNDILATANDGQGGKINITALRIYGFVPRLAGGTDNDGLRDNDTNDISATSEESSLSGQVIFDVLSVDPVQDLVELADGVVDRSNQIIKACSNSPNTLVVSGRGGLPARPSDTTSADGVDVPWVVDRGGTPTTIADSPTPPELEASPLVEAQAIEIDESGNAYFVADPEMTDMSQSSGMISGFCGSLQP